MPTKGTPTRTIRISDELWERAKAVAKEHGDNIADIIRAALVAYINSRGKK